MYKSRNHIKKGKPLEGKKRALRGKEEKDAGKKREERKERKERSEASQQGVTSFSGSLGCSSLLPTVCHLYDTAWNLDLS